MIILKSDSVVARMREAGRLVARVLRQCAESIQPNKTTPASLNFLAERMILEAGGFPAFKGYRGFPATLCVSVNEQVVHGIPGVRTIREGDLVTLDTGIFYQGFCADAAITVGVGRLSPDAQQLMNITEQSLQKAIEVAKAGNRLGDIGHAIQSHVEAQGFSVALGLAGHGVGRTIHEGPDVPNFGKPGTGMLLEPGMTLAIEPMINLGKPEVEMDEDDWTVITADRSLSAHFEHTIAITKHGVEILTVE